MKQEILSYIGAECPWRDTLLWFDTIGSTNTEAKALARKGAPAGTVLAASQQTGGRGRLGRSFSSPAGMGVYLSVILRPDCPAEDLMHLTCAAGVAMCRAVETASGIRPQIKWTNDLVIGKRKLGGILTELSVSPVTGRVEFAVVGIGINCRQGPGDFPPEIRDMATSLGLAAGKDVPPARLAGAMVEALYDMDRTLLTDKTRILEDYRKLCMTIGTDIQVVRGDRVRPGRALDLTDDGGLLVRYADGTLETVTSGEVSVRGMYGYL